MSEPTPPDLGLESIPVITVTTPPPPPSPLPSEHSWPPAIEITAPPTDTDAAFTTLNYGADPALVIIMGVVVIVSATNAVLTRYHGRRR